MNNPYLWFVLSLLDLYFYIMIASVVFSWLIAFNVLNGTNANVRQIGYALHRLTEPLLSPIRRILPDLGSIDISPIIALFGLQFLRNLIVHYSFYLFS